jgi:hypothetical protein
VKVLLHPTFKRAIGEERIFASAQEAIAEILEHEPCPQCDHPSTLCSYSASFESLSTEPERR